MVGALEAIKMNSPCLRDTGLEIVARCSLLVNRLLEGRIIQQSETAGNFFTVKLKGEKEPLPNFFSFFTCRVKKIVFGPYMKAFV